MQRCVGARGSPAEPSGWTSHLPLSAFKREQLASHKWLQSSQKARCSAGQPNTFPLLLRHRLEASCCVSPGSFVEVTASDGSTNCKAGPEARAGHRMGRLRFHRPACLRAPGAELPGKLLLLFSVVVVGEWGGGVQEQQHQLQGSKTTQMQHDFMLDSWWCLQLRHAVWRVTPSRFLCVLLPPALCHRERFAGLWLAGTKPSWRKLSSSWPSMTPT